MSKESRISKTKILVLGANGKTGLRLIQKLTALDWPVQGVSRSTSPKFDWNDPPSTWAPLLHKIDSVYVSYQPDLAALGSVEAITNFCKIAKQQGVKKLVLLSGRGEEEAQRCEEIVMDGGFDWTIIRASWFAQNFSEGNFLDPILAGHVALPVGDVGEPFIDTDDIADIAVAALTKEGHNKKLYEVTGPRLLSFRQAIDEIAKASGRKIQYQPIAIEEYRSTLVEYGLPTDIISLISYLLTEVLDGRNESITHGVEEALGRKATDFSEYARKAAAAGAWK